MRKTVVFDFDKTLTDKDTLLGFFRHCASKNAAYPFKRASLLFLAAASGMGLVSNESMKNAGIRLFLSRFNKKELEEKGREYAEGIKLNYVYYERFIKTHGRDNRVIASASFSLYLEPLFPGVPLAASEIDFIDGHADHVAFNCIGVNKRLRLMEMGIDRIDVLYTDSLNDKSLIEMSKTIVKVRKHSLTECRSLKDFRKK